MKRVGWLVLILVLILPRSLSSQTGAVQGRVVVLGRNDGIPNALVQLDGRYQTLSRADGSFRIPDLPAGRYLLRVSALGYRTDQRSLELSGDTTLTIALAAAPVALDTLVAPSLSSVDLRGTVMDAQTGGTLYNAEVVTDLNRSTRTSATGGFALRDVPEGQPVALEIRLLGYLPLDSMVTADRGATHRFRLVRDPIVQAIIDVQVARIDDRYQPQRRAGFLTIDRDRLLSRHNGRTVFDAIYWDYGPRLRFYCVMIDDRKESLGVEALKTIPASDIERVEVLAGGILRIYSREFVLRMSEAGRELARAAQFKPMCA